MDLLKNIANVLSLYSFVCIIKFLYQYNIRDDTLQQLLLNSNRYVYRNIRMSKESKNIFSLCY